MNDPKSRQWARGQGQALWVISATWSNTQRASPPGLSTRLHPPPLFILYSGFEGQTPAFLWQWSRREVRGSQTTYQQRTRFQNGHQKSRSASVDGNVYQFEFHDSATKCIHSHLVPSPWWGEVDKGEGISPTRFSGKALSVSWRPGAKLPRTWLARGD